MSGSVPAQGRTYEDLGNKAVSELISPDTSIDFLGNVTGTLKYVAKWEDFSTNPDEQTGHFFPVHIDDAYQGQEITCIGKNTTKANDLDWVVRVEGKESTFTFKCEDKTILTLNFSGATFASAPVGYAAAAAPKTKRAVRKKTEE